MILFSLSRKRDQTMNSSLKGRFFTNECYVCRSRKKLKRCDCNKIAYCSEDHRLQHLSIHENFCKAVQQVLKEKALLRFYKKLPPKVNNNIWDDASEDKVDLEKKLGRHMTPLELSMWIRPRVCFICSNSKGYLYNCPNCPIVSFCKSHKSNQEHTEHCKLMNRYLKTLSTAEKLNIDLQFLPLCFPYTTEDRFEFLDPLTYTVNDYHYESKCNESASMKENLIDFINIASKLNVALEKIYDTFPENIVIHIEAFHHNRAIVKEHYWEFLLHSNPKLKNLKIIITRNNLLKSSLENYSLCENCVKLEKTLSVEKCSSTYDDYMLQDNYQVPDVLFYFKILNEYNFKRFNEWIKIGCPIVLLTYSKTYFFREPYFLSFLYGNLEMVFNGEINTDFNEKNELETDSQFIIFQSKRIKKEEISLADNCNESETKLMNLNSTKDDSITIENNDESLGEDKFAENNSSAKGTEEANYKTLSPFFSTIVSKHKEEDGSAAGNIENNDNSKFDDDVKFLSKKNEFLLTENSYLKTKNKRLQRELNSSIENVAKKQKRIVQLEGICIKEIEKNN